MCGIFGLIDFRNGAELHRQQIDSATDQMSHRGPDGRGVWIDGAAGFGHRRLAIIDPAGSPQPMVSKEGRFALTYNGELYNYRQLRQELVNEGITFQTLGDTEVVLAALIQWGSNALAKFNGMFALGFWDNYSESVIIARDRLGVKPLLYSLKEGILAFASEYPPLLGLGWISKTPDWTGVSAYLSHSQTTFAGGTIYRDVKSLEGGEFAVFNRSGLSLARYWSLPKTSSEEKRLLWQPDRFNEAKEEVIRLTNQAVNSHSIADVVVGSFLSGGIDSAVITTLMCGQSSERVRAYSIGFPEEGFNEFEFSSAVTERLSLDHKIITFLEDDYFPVTNFLIRHKGAPLSTPNETPIFQLSKIAARDIKVVLTGEGSDELFGGYTAILRSPADYLLAEKLRQRPDEFSANERDLIRQTIRKIYGKSGFKGAVDHWTTTYAWLSRTDIQTIFGSDVDLSTAFRDIDEFWETKFVSLPTLDPFDRLLYILESEHLRGLLSRLDACTMAGSLEGRVPFTDNDLVEFVWSLPYDFKVRLNREWQMSDGSNLEDMNTGKWILKEAFKPHLGEQIALRRKRAFPVPLEGWLNGKHREWIIGELGQQSPFFSDKIVEWVKATLQSGNGAMKVWMVWNLGQWFKNVIA